MAAGAAEYINLGAGRLANQPAYAPEGIIVPRPLLCNEREEKEPMGPVFVSYNNMVPTKKA